MARNCAAPTYCTPLAGRSPSYLLRQLLAFKAGTRASDRGRGDAPVVEKLSLGDLIAVAAYAER